MKKVSLQEESTINISDIKEHVPIFAKDKDGNLCGMVVNEIGKGWILRIGGAGGSDGWHPTRTSCLLNSVKYGYEFFI